MFKWLNERLAGTSHFKAAEALRIELEPLQKVKGVQPRLVDRLIRFVFTGEDEDVVAELAALQNTRYTITVPFNYSLSSPTSRKGLPALIKQLPEDPKIYFRLATVYDAAYQAGSTVSYGSLPVAMLHGSLSWLNVFLGELSNQGKQRDAIFPVNMILEMLRVAGEDPNVLVKAAFF